MVCHNNDCLPKKDQNQSKAINAQQRIVIAVLLINLVMFGVEFIGSIISQSVALQADAFDFLSDSLIYGLTLITLGFSLRWRALTGLFKGIAMGVFGIWVIAKSTYQAWMDVVPEPILMGSLAIVAFIANLICAFLLYRFRTNESNLRSIWLCSRNDALVNIAVFAAAGSILIGQVGWPDWVVAIIIACLFLTSSWQIIRQSLAELKTI